LILNKLNKYQNIVYCAQFGAAAPVTFVSHFAVTTLQLRSVLLYCIPYSYF